MSPLRVPPRTVQLRFETEVRAAPSVAATVIRRAKTAEELTVVGFDSGFAMIELGGSTTAYVRQDAIGDYEPPRGLDRRAWWPAPPRFTRATGFASLMRAVTWITIGLAVIGVIFLIAEYPSCDIYDMDTAEYLGCTDDQSTSLTLIVGGAISTFFFALSMFAAAWVIELLALIVAENVETRKALRSMATPPSRSEANPNE